MDGERRHRWIDRHRSEAPLVAASPFVVGALEILAADAPSSQRALDVACGRGRHALLLATHGYDVTAVDCALPALTALQHTAHARGLTIRCLAADVTTWPFPAARYALVVVVNFLERALFGDLRRAVAPGGALLVETFLRGDHTLAAINPAFLLAPGELEDACRGWDILARHAGPDTHDAKAVTRAGILARRPLAASGATGAH